MRTPHFLPGMLGAVASAALLLALNVHAQTSPPTSGQTGTSTTEGAAGQSGQSGTGAAAGSTTPGAATLNAADQKMLKTMAINNLAEIEAGRMAHTKTENEQVRSFAQRMIDDHTKALDEVRQLAQAKGVSLPTELDSANKRKAARLAAMSGEAFDRAYMAQAGVADHKKNHALLQQAQTRARDPDLKALAARTLTLVDQHLSSAQELHKSTARGSSRTEGRTGASPGKQD